MGWGEVPVAPTVTMSCPGATVYGTPPTVTATVNQNATIVFYLDGTQVSSSSGTSASYTPGTGVSVGTHTIRVVASNTNGSGSVTCSWVVNPPAPTVTMECPGATVYGTPPTLTASVNYSATIAFSLSDAQGTVISTQSTNGTSASFTPSSGLSPGTYSVCVRATNISGTSNPVCCSWIVEDLEITLTCPGSTTYGVHPSFYAAINAPSTVTFYLDGNPIIPSWSGTQGVTYNPSTDVAVGTHVVSVHAVCGGEEASAECTWIVLPEPLEITRDDPTVAIINDTIDGSTEEKSFRAYTNRQDATISFSVNPTASCIVDDQVTLTKGATRTAHVTVESAGMYTITATATVSGDSKSVNWRWMLQNTCSYGYEANGGIWIHVCASDAISVSAAAGATQGALILAEIITAAAAAEFSAGLAIVLAPIWITCRNSDGSLDVFIDPESYLALQGFVPGGPALTIAVIILETKYYMTTGGE